jgi:hypothetical protein
MHVKNRIFLIVPVTVLLCGPAIAWQQVTPRTDAVEAHAAEVAGSNAINCGRVPARQDPKTATGCALDAQKARKPFRVIYDVQGIDSRFTIAIVRSPNGLVQTLSNEVGMGSATGPGRLKPCPVPVRLWVGPQGFADCSRRRIEYP